MRGASANADAATGGRRHGASPAAGGPSATGDFRFYAAPGKWTLSALHRDGAARKDVVALEPGLVEVRLVLS